VASKGLNGTENAGETTEICSRSLERIYMSLRIYSYDDLTETYTQHSVGGSFDTPVVFVQDPREQSVVVRKLYLRNDDPDVYYESVALQYTPTTITVDNSNGLIFKILRQDRQPTEAEWATVESGEEIEVGDIGDADSADLSYWPFWVRIDLPRGYPAGTYRDVFLSIFYDAEVSIVS
jgi:hypothetical protein